MNVPAARCHPHCQLGQGDEYSVPLDPPSNGDSLSSASSTCSGGGCPFEDEIGITQPDQQHLVYHIRSRSEAVTATITAQGTHMVPNTIPVVLLGQTAVYYDQPFSVVVPSDVQNATLQWNGLAVPLSGLASGPWNSTELTVVDPGSPTGGGSSVTFKIAAPACDAGAV